MSGIGQSEEGVASTSGMMETSMMEGEEYYNPGDTSTWTQKEMSEQLCRICSKPNQYLIPIFEGEGIEHQLESKIQKHLPIEVLETDELPLQVCYQCASTLIAWNDLVIACIEADKKLRQLFQHHEDQDDKGAEFFDEPILDSDEGEEPTHQSTSPATVISDSQTEILSTKRSPGKAKKSKLQTALLKSSTAGPSGHKPLSKKTVVSSQDDAVQEGTERFHQFSGWSSLPKSQSTFLVGILADEEPSFSVKKRSVSGIFMDEEESYSPNKDSFSKQIFEGSESKSPTMTKLPVTIFTNEESTASSKNRLTNTVFPDKEKLHVLSKNKFSSGIFYDDYDDEWNNGSFLDSECKEMRNKEIVDHTCPLCGKGGMDEDEYKAHGIVHIQESNSENGVESFSIQIKKASTSKVMINHIKCSLADEGSSNRFVYSCSYCGQDNFVASASCIAMHIRKKCLPPWGESEMSSNEDTMDTTYEVTFLTDNESCDSRSSTRSRKRNFSNSMSSKVSDNSWQDMEPSLSRKPRDSTGPYGSQIREITQNNIIQEIAAIFNSFETESSNIPEPQPFDITTLVQQTMVEVETQQSDVCIMENEPSNMSPLQHEVSGLATVEYEPIDVSVVQHEPSDMSLFVQHVTEVCTSELEPSDLTVVEVSTSDHQPNISTPEYKLLPTVLQTKPCIVSKEVLVASLVSADDNAIIQVALEQNMVNSENKLMLQQFAHGTDLLKCKHCEEQFFHGPHLVRHMRKNHPISEQFLCVVCGKIYLGNKQLHRHVLLHKKDTVSCDECNKSFHNKMMLKMHTLIHTGKLPYECSVCYKGFVFNINLQQHCMLEHNIVEKNCPCTVCGQAFKTDNGLKKHQNREHSREQDHLCAVCGKIFSSRSKLTSHMVTHGPRKHICEVCGYKSYSLNLLKNHMLRHENKKDFICEMCGETFYLPAELKRHVFNNHTDELPEKCPHCDRAFKFRNRLKQHLILTHRLYQEGRKIFSCEICSQLFVSQKKLADHMNLHTGSRPYQCSVCKHMFRSQHSLHQHIARHKQDQRPKNTYPCDTCGRKFKNEQTLRIHNQSYNCGETEVSPTHHCDSCDRAFLTAWMLRRHTTMFHTESGVLAHKRHICVVCNEPFYSKETLAEHKRKAHPIAGRSGRPYQCNQCDKSYRTYGGLYQHRVGKHSLRVKVYPCKICDKVMSSSGALYLHNRCKHGINAREYVCDECGKSFNLKTTLLKHKNIHMDIKDRQTFPCDLCSKVLTTKWSLKVHMRAHKGIKPFACDVCSHTFTQSGDRNKHRQTTHKGIPLASACL